MSYLEIEKAYSFVSILKDKYDHEDTILGKKFNIFQIIQKGHEEVSLPLEKIKLKIRNI